MAAEPSPEVHKPAKYIKGIERFNLVNDLAVGDESQVTLAAKYGRTREAIAQFAIRNRQEIEEAREKIYDDYQHLPLTKKSIRIEDLHELRDIYKADLADPKLAYSARTRIGNALQKVLHQIAEEMNQLPARTTLEVNSVPKLTHEVVGWDPVKWAEQVKDSEPEELR